MELFKLFGRVAIDNNEANRSINETAEEGKNAESKLQKAFSNIGNFAVKLGKTVVAGIGVASVAIGKLTKDAVEAYADYEQLVGGVETLFKNSADTVMQYANNAYKTAGLSANEYMDTVTSFSASLLQGLGGDTEAAAKIANVAITDMSDNANKMGTDMSMIQNAYQGFAKQNYTMLDNLKLGYGGTATEMARLINDSGVLGDTMTVTAETVNEVSFDKMIEAIHVVQDNMGITGTTAKEASSTIQGSVASMKSSWQNLLVGLADDTQDFNTLIDNFVNSVVTVGENLIPRIKTTLEGITNLISAMLQDVAPMLLAEIPGIISQIFPGLINAAVQLINGLVAALPGIITALSAILPMLLEGIVSITTALVNALPGLINSLVTFLVENIPVVADAAVQLLMSIVNALPDIISALVSALPQLIPVAIQAIVTLVEGIAQALPQLVAAIPSIISAIVTTLITLLPQLTPAAIDIIFALINGLLGAIPELSAAIPNIIMGIVQGILDNLPTIILCGPQIIVSLITGLINAIPQLVNAIPQIILSIVRTFASYDWLSVGKNIIEGLISGLNSMISKVGTAIANIGSSIKNKFTEIKDTVLGIFSKMKISLPNIKLPHFSITPSGWKFSDLLKGSIPKLGISWYAKAMDDGMIMNSPTIFGVNGNGQLMGGGEAGSETVVGTASLMSMIRDAVNNETSNLSEGIERIVSTLLQYFPEFAMNKKVVLDSGVLVGEIAPDMDSAFGNINRMKVRGQ